MAFLFVGSQLGRRLPSDPSSRRRPCLWLAVVTHSDYLMGSVLLQGTCTPSIHAHAGRTTTACSGRRCAPQLMLSVSRASQQGGILVEAMRLELAAMCEAFALDGAADAAAAPRVSEAYIPYVPEGWNGVLVLAEAQNLGARNQGYVDWLEKLPRELRVRRLEQWPDGSLAVGPWDDGTLKLAVEAALQVDATKVAVSNAVPWAVVSSGGANVNPLPTAQAKASELWAAMLMRMRPRSIVTAGKVARTVVRDALRGVEPTPAVFHWALPSPRVVGPLSIMLRKDSLLERFPEVAKVLAARPAWLDGAADARQVFYACMAVSASGPGGSGAG